MSITMPVFKVLAVQLMRDHGLSAEDLDGILCDLLHTLATTAERAGDAATAAALRNAYEDAGAHLHELAKAPACETCGSQLRTAEGECFTCIQGTPCCRAVIQAEPTPYGRTERATSCSCCGIMFLGPHPQPPLPRDEPAQGAA